MRTCRLSAWSTITWSTVSGIGRFSCAHGTSVGLLLPPDRQVLRHADSVLLPFEHEANDRRRHFLTIDDFRVNHAVVADLAVQVLLLTPLVEAIGSNRHLRSVENPLVLVPKRHRELGSLLRMHLTENAVDPRQGDLVVARAGEHIHHQTDSGHDGHPAEEWQALEKRILLQRDRRLAFRETAQCIARAVPRPHLPGESGRTLDRGRGLADLQVIVVAAPPPQCIWEAPDADRAI